MVVISASWKEFQKNRRECRQDTHSQYTTVCSQAWNAHTQRAWLKNCIVILCAWKEFSHLVCSMSHPWLTCLSPRALHLPHSLFLLRDRNMQHNGYDKNNSENTRYITQISKLHQSTSCAIKNHSSVKNCRVAETRAPQLPQVMSPSSLRLSQGSMLILETHINYVMYMKKLEKITELLSPKKWWNLERLGRLACWILKYQRRPNFQSQMHFDDSVESIAFWSGRWRVYKRCWRHHCMTRKLRGDPMQWSCREREVSAQYTQADRKESLRSRSSEGQKALGKPTALFSSERGNLIRSSVLRNANPSNLRGSLLEGNKDHLLNQARSDPWRSKKVHVESLNKCIGELQRQTEEQICWRYRTRNTELLTPDENKFDCKKNCHWKKKFSEILKSEICTTWEKFKKSSRTTKRGGLSAETKRKPWDNSSAHFPIAADARTDEFYEWFWRFSRCGIEL